MAFYFAIYSKSDENIVLNLPNDIKKSLTLKPIDEDQFDEPLRNYCLILQNLLYALLERKSTRIL